MAIPDYRIDYSDTALEVYEMAMWKGYKFLKGRNLDSWLQYAWSILFQRKMTEHDIRMLKDFITTKKKVDLKIKCKQRLDHKERNFTTQYIGKDGYVYMNKMMISGELVNPKETARLQKLLEEAKEERLARYEEYEIRHLNEMSRKAWFNNQEFTYKGQKVKWK
jgi:hypothetical protein